MYIPRPAKLLFTVDDGWNKLFEKFGDRATPIWGGGEVVSAEGMRFVVPVHTVHAGPNPKHFKEGRGVTWYNLISDQYSGINDIVVPGTLRDSLVILAVVLEQQMYQMPYYIMTDTGGYSDVIFWLFRLLGYRFCPRIAGTEGARFWRTDLKADYGPFNAISSHRLNFWEKNRAALG